MRALGVQAVGAADERPWFDAKHVCESQQPHVIEGVLGGAGLDRA